VLVVIVSSREVGLRLALITVMESQDSDSRAMERHTSTLGSHVGVV
jgi:hypothetical protein